MDNTKTIKICFFLSLGLNVILFLAFLSNIEECRDAEIRGLSKTSISHSNGQEYCSDFFLILRDQTGEDFRVRITEDQYNVINKDMFKYFGKYWSDSKSRRDKCIGEVDYRNF